MKVKFSILLFVTALTVETYGQTREIYVNPKFREIAGDHKVVAILPFKTIITLRPNQMSKMTPEQFAQLQRDEGLAVQSALLSYFLKRKEQHEFALEFQDLGKTNAILSRNNIDQANIQNYPPDELAALLGVDAVITGRLETTKPMSDAASLALGVLVGVYGPTNAGKVTIVINDGPSGDLLWKYDKTLSRSLGSDTHTIINTMMRKASRQLPYIE